MIYGQLKRAQFVLTMLVFLVPLVSFSVAGFLRFGTHLLPRYTSDADPGPYFGLLLLTTVFWAVSSEHYGLTLLEDHFQTRSKARRVILACFSTYLAVLSVTFFYRETTFSRLFIWISGMNIALLAMLVPKLFRRFLSQSASSAASSVHFLIVGADEFASRVAASLLSSRVASCDIKGHIRLPGQNVAIKDRPVFELSQVEKLAIGNGFTDLILAIPPDRLSDLPALRQQLAPLCAPMRVALNFGDFVEPGQNLFCLGDLLMVDLEATHAESPIYVIMKRAFDLVFSAMVLVLTFPVFAIIALAVRLTSPGPVIFAQDRVGLNGKLFRMYKFRTMREAPGERYTRWTVKNDPRITRVGKMLRQTSLDELPQFFNVLKGDMSVVGPRPEGPILVQRFMQSVGNYNTRHYLKVGITGWAQVNGWRGDTSIEKRVEYDLYYVRHWTLAFDLWIVLMTFFRGFSDKNAY